MGDKKLSGLFSVFLAHQISHLVLSRKPSRRLRSALLSEDCGSHVGAAPSLLQSQYLYFPASATSDVAVFGRKSGFGGIWGLSDAVLRTIAARCTCGPSL